jgi:hypothetical protein
MSTVIDATRPVDVQRLEFDPEDFIAFAAPFLRHGWRLAAGSNLYWSPSWGPPRYTHTVLLFRVNSEGKAEYRKLSDHWHSEPVPREVYLEAPDDRRRWCREYRFVYFSTLFPGVKPTKGEQKEFGIDDHGNGETWAEDTIDEDYVRTMIYGK